MTIRVSPSEVNPSHHIALHDRNGRKVGLILCDSQGNIRPDFNMNPVERTALKTTSGNSTYTDFEYPYSPITQDDWSGGRGGLDFERDTTKFYDSFRLRTAKSNRVFLGPQEQYSTGYRSQDKAMPGNVKFHKLTGDGRFVAKRFQASATYTAAQVWVLARRKGEPGDLTVAIYSDNAGQIDASLESITVAYTRMPDILSEWLDETVSEALTSGTYYWLVVWGASGDDEDDHWQIAVKSAVGTTYQSDVGGTWGNWSAADFDLYYRLADADADKMALFYEYKEQQYVVINPTSGAPKVYMNGDRGAADSNAGQLTKVIDATKAWTASRWSGCVVMIVDGTGKAEAQPWRYISDSDTTTLTVSEAWTITHDITTEYVILGSNEWTELTGHGLTAPVTSVLVATNNVVYFAQGDGVNIRRHREYNNAGAWTANDWADDGTNKARFLVYKTQAAKIFRGQNNDASGDVSVSSGDVPAAWGTDITFGTVSKVGSKYRRINSMDVYPDDDGNEAVWCFKADKPWIVPGTGNPYPISLREMDAVRSTQNGKAALVHNVYLFFTLMNGLERYYTGTLDDLGPNLGEGLPSNRQGGIAALLGYPGKFFAAIDAGAGGYSSVIEKDGNGWHERYRAPKGKRIQAIAFQPVPGTVADRMWIYQGNDLVWLPFPNDTTNELQDANYLYTHEGALETCRMHAGMMDVQKMVKTLKLWTQNLAADVCWLELDYRIDDGDWETVEEIFSESPISRADFTSVYGLTGKRVQLRVRFYTADAAQTPILLATIIEAVMRVSVKYMYPITFRLMDNEETLNNAGPDEIADGIEKLQILQDWADDTSDSMLWMTSISRLFHGKMVFLNPPTVRQMKIKADPANELTRDVYICTTSLQEA